VKAEEVKIITLLSISHLSSSQSNNQSICFDSAQYSKFPVFHYSRSVVLLDFLLFPNYQHPDSSAITSLPFYHSLITSIWIHQYYHISFLSLPIIPISHFFSIPSMSLYAFQFPSYLPIFLFSQLPLSSTLPCFPQGVGLILTQHN
jgi:hypothetical protein